MARKIVPFLFALVVATGALFAHADEYPKGQKVRLLFVFDANAVDYLEGQGNTCDNFAGNCVARMNQVLTNSKLNEYFTYELAGTTQTQAKDTNLTTAYNKGWAYLCGGENEEWDGVLEARAAWKADVVVNMVYTGTSGGLTGQSHPYSGTTTEYAKNYAGSAFSCCSIQTAELEISGTIGQFQVCSHEVAHTLGCGHSDTQDNQSGQQSASYSFGYQFRYPGNQNYTVLNGNGYSAWYGCTVMAYKEHFFKNEDGTYMTRAEALEASGWTDDDDGTKFWDNTDGGYSGYGNGVFNLCNQLPYFSSPDYCFVSMGDGYVSVVDTEFAQAHYDEGTYVPMGDEKHNNRQVLIDNYQYASRWHLGVKFSKDGNESVVNGASDKLTLTALSDNCTVYYTTDGTEPTKENGTQYTEPFSLTQATTVKARAYDAQDNAGDVLSKAYTMLPLATALGNTELTWTTSSPAWYVDNGVARSALINDDGVTSTLSTVIAGPAKLTFEYAAELMDSDVFAVTVGGTKVLEATEYNSEFTSSGEIAIPEGDQTVVFSYTVNFNMWGGNHINLRNVSVKYGDDPEEPETPTYAGPEATAVWQTSEFGKTKNGYSIELNDNTINDNGNIVIGSLVTKGIGISIPSGNSSISVLVKLSDVPNQNGPRAIAAAYATNTTSSPDVGLRSWGSGNSRVIAYYDVNSGSTTWKYLYSDTEGTETITGNTLSSGYLLFSYDLQTVRGYNGSSLDSLSGGVSKGDECKWPNRDITYLSIGGPTGKQNTTYDCGAWAGMVIEKVALFVGEALTDEDIANYQFPEPTTGAKLVNGETVTYSETIEGAIFPGLFKALGANPNAYVQVLDPNAETPNIYAEGGIAYDSVNRRYCKAVAKIGSAGYISLADAWTVAGKGADTATITILSEPSDAVVVGAGQTLKVIAGSADLSDNVSFAAGLMTYTTTSGSVTTYTARNKGTTLPGIDTNVPMTVGDFALDSSGEWAEILDAPIRMTLDPSVNRFKLLFDVEIPTGVYGTLFSWDSTNSDESVDSRVVITNDASKMVIYRKNDGTLSTVGYSESTLITSGQHTITVQWAHNAGCTIYVDGNKCYSSSSLAFTNHDTTKLAIGGSALGSPDDVLSGLKVRNFTYIVHSDVVTRLDGTIYHGNDANRAVITNYLSQMVGHRPVKMPAPNTVDLLLVYDPNAVDYALEHYATVEEHAAHNVAVMNQALTTTDIDTNVWFRIAGIYQIDVAAAHVDDALKRLNGEVSGWEQVASERERVGADVVLGVVYSNSNYGLANWCSPAEIMNGGGANYAFAGVRADAAWSWVHEVGHTASLYHSPGEAAGSYNNPTSIGCGFSKTAEADMAELRSIMASGTAQLAFSSPNHKSHGEIYSVTNAVGEYVDSSGELARLLPYMAKYRDTVVNAWTITPQSGSTVTSGDTMTVTCEDPDATIWYSLYGEETETQYTEPVAISTSSIYCVNIKKGDDTVVTTYVSYRVDQTQSDPENVVPGTLSQEETTQSNVVLDSSGEWAVIQDKPIFFTVPSNTNVFTVAFDAYVPDGEGTVFGFQMTKDTITTEIKARRTSGGTFGGFHTGTDAVTDYTGGTTVLTPGAHNIKVEYDHRNTLDPTQVRGTTIYVDGTNVYHATGLSWKDRSVTLFSIGGAAIATTPTDVLSGLKVKNLVFLDGVVSQTSYVAEGESTTENVELTPKQAYIYETQIRGREVNVKLNGASTSSANAARLVDYFGLESADTVTNVVFDVESIDLSDIANGNIAITPEISPALVNGTLWLLGSENLSDWHEVGEVGENSKFGTQNYNFFKFEIRD